MKKIAMFCILAGTCWLAYAAGQSFLTWFDIVSPVNPQQQLRFDNKKPEFSIEGPRGWYLAVSNSNSKLGDDDRAFFFPSAPYRDLSLGSIPVSIAVKVRNAREWSPASRIAQAEVEFSKTFGCEIVVGPEEVRVKEGVGSHFVMASRNRQYHNNVYVFSKEGFYVFVKADYPVLRQNEFEDAMKEAVGSMKIKGSDAGGGPVAPGSLYRDRSEAERPAPSLAELGYVCPKGQERLRYTDSQLGFQMDGPPGWLMKAKDLYKAEDKVVFLKLIDDEPPLEAGRVPNPSISVSYYPNPKNSPLDRIIGKYIARVKAKGYKVSLGPEKVVADGKQGFRFCTIDDKGKVGWLYYAFMKNKTLIWIRVFFNSLNSPGVKRGIQEAIDSIFFF